MTEIILKSIKINDNIKLYTFVLKDNLGYISICNFNYI